MKQIESVGNILSRILEKKKFKKIIEQQHLLEEWSNIVGDVIAEKAVAKMIKKGRLIIEVQNSLWMQELSFMREELLEKVKNCPGGEEVEEIQFIPKG